ncbi:MAG TPA: plastocyanin/azurin family copper-binding protein [Actinomycetota bacterium]|nr:plastocyanin/azurin family copper-binding protein [Actinomycetota bacterium]
MKVVGRVVLAAALVAAAGACTSSDPDRIVEISIRHSRFEPSLVSVEPGEHVLFVIRNGDPIAHEFILGDEEVQRVHEEGTEARHGAKPGEVSVAAGATAETTYTFAGPGSLIFGCHLPGHYDYGMRGTVRIG